MGNTGYSGRQTLIFSIQHVTHRPFLNARYISPKEVFGCESVDKKGEMDSIAAIGR
jgi:hypothetical protein